MPAATLTAYRHYVQREKQREKQRVRGCDRLIRCDTNALCAEVAGKLHLARREQPAADGQLERWACTAYHGNSGMAGGAKTIIGLLGPRNLTSCF